MTLFDNYVKIETVEMPDTNLKCSVRHNKLMLKKVEQKNNAIEALTPLPEIGTTDFIVTNGYFDFYDFIPAIIEMVGKPAIKMIASTWIMNRANIVSMIEMYRQNKIQSIDMYVGSYFKQRESSNYATLAEFCIKNNQRLKAGKNHSKFFALKFDEHNAFVMQSSANFTENGNVETHCLINSIELFNFHFTWMDKILKGG